MPYTEFPVPRAEADLTASWFSSLLDPAVVESVTLERLPGLLNAPFRVRLTYAGGPTAGPPSVVVKLGGSHDREFAFYRDLAPHLPVGRPRLHASLEGSGGHFVLVLEDLLLRPAVRPFGPGDLALAVETLARRLHPAYWASPELTRHPYLRSMASFVERVQSRLAAGTPRLLERFRDTLDPAGLELFERLPGAFGKAAAPLVDAPPTLCHHDLNRRNLFVEGTGANRELIFIDWQLAQAVPGVRDLSFLVGCEGGGLSGEEEHALLQRYHAGLVAESVAGYEFEHLVEDYRRSVICDFGRMAMTASNPDLADGMWAELASQLRNRAGAVERWGLLELL